MMPTSSRPVAREYESMPGSMASQAGAGGAIGGLALCVLLASLGTSIANVGLPEIGTAFAAPFAALQWVVVAYLLGATALVVGAGRLGDMLGRRRLLLAGLALFVAASAASGAAPSLEMLIAARAMQGLGSAIIMALSMAMITEAVPKGATGRALGLLGAMSAAGTALGPVLGGVLVAGFGWRAAFLVNLPLGLLAAVLLRRCLPADRPGSAGGPRGFDGWGTLVLAGTLAAYALAVTVGAGRTGVIMAGLLVLALIGASLFLWIETRVSSPLLHPAVFREGGIRKGLVASLLVSTVMMTTLVVGPFHLSRALGLETIVVGLCMSVGPVVAAVLGVPSGRLVDRFGTQRMTQLGLAGMFAGCGAIALLPPSLGAAGYVVPLAVLTAGYALFQAANNTAVMSGVDQGRRGVVSGALNLSRSLGLMTGASVMGAVFAFGSGGLEPGGAGPEALATGTRVTFAIAAALVAVGFAVVGAVLRCMGGVLPNEEPATPGDGSWRQGEPGRAVMPDGER